MEWTCLRREKCKYKYGRSQSSQLSEHYRCVGDDCSPSLLISLRFFSFPNIVGTHVLHYVCCWLSLALLIHGCWCQTQEDINEKSRSKENGQSVCWRNRILFCVDSGSPQWGPHFPFLAIPINYCALHLIIIAGRLKKRLANCSKFWHSKRLEGDFIKSVAILASRLAGQQLISPKLCWWHCPLILLPWSANSDKSNLPRQSDSSLALTQSMLISTAILFLVVFQTLWHLRLSESGTWQSPRAFLILSSNTVAHSVELIDWWKAAAEFVKRERLKGQAKSSSTFRLEFLINLPCLF